MALFYDEASPPLRDHVIIPRSPPTKNEAQSNLGFCCL